MDFSDIQQGELFPVQAGKEAYRKLEETLANKDRQIELMLSQLPGGMLICGKMSSILSNGSATPLSSSWIHRA